MSENFQWLVLVSLQHLQFKTNFDSYEYHDNWKITKCLGFLPNIIFPTSLSWEQCQASEEERISHKISHPPSYLFPNEVLVTNNLDHVKCLYGIEPTCITSERIIHPIESKLEDQVDITFLHVNETNL